MTDHTEPENGGGAEVEAGARGLFEHFHGKDSRYGGHYVWPAPEQHMPWWRAAAEAVLDAAGYVSPAEVARREGEAAQRALREAAEAMVGGEHSCFHPQGCVECGRQKERDGRVRWLRARADRLAAGGE